MRLELSVHAVKFRLASAYRKLGVANRTEAHICSADGSNRHRRAQEATRIVDLRLYLRVIRRFWPLVALGTAVALVLSFISYFRVDFHQSPHVTYRQHETWKGTEILVLTQRGFPWGRSVYPTS